MPIKTRDDSGIWWLDFSAPNGERIRRSCKTTEIISLKAQIFAFWANDKTMELF